MWPKECKILHNKRVFVVESEQLEDFFKDVKKKDEDFVDVHPKLGKNGFYQRPDHVIGAVDIGKTFLVTGLNEEFVAQYDLTLDGLKELKRIKKTLCKGVDIFGSC